MKTFLGIEIGGSKLQLFVGDASAKILERCRLTVDPKRGGDGIRAQIAENLPLLLKKSDVAAIAVGFGGPVDRRTGRIARSHQIEGWSDFDLQGWLRELSGKPVLIDNDANMGALGEALHGAGKGFDPVFYVTLGSGVGGGLAVNGEIYHGAAPGESEIGHLRLDREGTIVEERCSGWAVDRKIRELKKSGRPSALADLVGET
ncbi:MAG TPA: ROK family protein, partial [Verrucomicrobiae bacterium]|nr:ROK family protein [Verrucomicrobiae bacterium]